MKVLIVSSFKWTLFFLLTIVVSCKNSDPVEVDQKDSTTTLVLTAKNNNSQTYILLVDVTTEFSGSTKSSSLTGRYIKFNTDISSTLHKEIISVLDLWNLESAVQVSPFLEEKFKMRAGYGKSGDLGTQKILEILGSGKTTVASNFRGSKESDFLITLLSALSGSHSVNAEEKIDELTRDIVDASINQAKGCMNPGLGCYKDIAELGKANANLWKYVSDNVTNAMDNNKPYTAGDLHRDVKGNGSNEPQKKDPAHGTGDPHLMTFDGVSYDFQSRGEFIATKSTTDNFEVQVRQEDVNQTGYISFNTAIAVQTGTDVVCFSVKPSRLFVNKQPQDLSKLTTLWLKDGASVSMDEFGAYNIINKNGDVVKVVLRDYYLDYYLYLAENRKEKVIGLMGNYDGNKTNDILVRNGENILNDGSIPFAKLYPTYADSWRITQANSLFYYDSGKNTDSYTERDFPRSIHTLTAEQKIKAEGTCRAAGVTAEPFLSNCIIDVAITNNPALATSAQYGQNTDQRVTTPIPVVFETVDVKTINSLGSCSFILKKDGTLWVSGVNNNGEFGAGQAKRFSTNNKFVKIMEDIKDIAKGDGDHMLFLKNDNSVWAAGANQYGQIGNGAVSSDGILTAVKIMTDAKDIFIGQNNSFVLKNDNTLWGFGYNYGLLGNGWSTMPQTIPVKIMSDVKSMSIGRDHALVLKMDNSLWAFGDNSYGAFGFSREVKSSSNVPFKLMDNVKGMAAGFENSFVIKTDNTLWASGRNVYGVLGNGTITNTSQFAKMMDNVTNVVANTNCVLIQKGDNTLWGTGSNSAGTLGIGTNSEVQKPVQITTDISYVASGYAGSFIVKKDNTLWASGSNGQGQLGSVTYNGIYPYGSLSFFQINVK